MKHLCEQNSFKDEGNEVTANNRRESRKCWRVASPDCLRSPVYGFLELCTVVRLLRSSALCNNGWVRFRAIFKRAAFVDSFASSRAYQNFKLISQPIVPLRNWISSLRVTLSSNESVSFRFNRPVKQLSFRSFFFFFFWKMREKFGRKRKEYFFEKSLKLKFRLKRDKLFLFEIVGYFEG